MKSNNILKYFIILVLLNLVSCERKKEIPTHSDCFLDEVLSEIELYNVSEIPIVNTIRLSGKIIANPEKTVHYTSIISAKIVKLFYSVGDYVKKGQKLAELQSSELYALFAQVKVIQTEQELIEHRLHFVNNQFEDGFASKSELLSIMAELKQVSQMKQKLKNKIALFDGNLTTGMFYLRSPAYGYIVRNNLSVGTHIYPEAETLFTISELDEVWVIADVYTGLIKSIRHGMQAEIHTTAYKDTVFRGKVNFVSNFLDPERKVLEARIELLNSKRLLKPEMFVDVHVFENNIAEKALAVPVDAVIFDNNQNHVLVLNDSCKIDIRVIDVIAERNDMTFVQSGIEEGEQIILSNAIYWYYYLVSKNYHHK